MYNPTIPISYEGVDYPSVNQFANAVSKGAHKTVITYTHPKSLSNLIRRRLKEGWSIQRILNTPVKSRLNPQQEVEKRKTANQWVYHRGLECSRWPTCRKIKGWT